MAFPARVLSAVLLFGFATSGRSVNADPAADPAATEFFEKEIRPVLATRCFECHGEGKKLKGGLNLTSRAELLKGGDSGPAAVAGKPEDSLLVQAVKYIDEPRMPPKQRLSDREVASLTKWVGMGLPWPSAGSERPAGGGPRPSFQIRDEQRQFWSFQPVKDPRPPQVRDTLWPKATIDRFILAKLEAKGLRPSKPADRRTLIRRATFDLTGLPPTPEEVDAFVNDRAPDAFATVVDRLLASTAYGERWGRHWLDVVRYADSFDARGLGSEGDIAFAWRYRDWVVRAFNEDLPYDQFVRQQIAGDVLTPPNRNGFRPDGIIATGMLAIGNWGGGDADKEKLLTDIADDQVDVVSRSFLGLTIACARCHDHKFDPISTNDYYGLAGIFFSTHILPNLGPKTNGPPMLRIPLASTEELAMRDQSARKLAELEATLTKTLDEKKRSLARQLQGETARYIEAAWNYASAEAPTGRSLPDFAASQGLHEFALRRWLRSLGLATDAPLLARSVSNVLGNPAVFAWRGNSDPPALLVNTANAEAALLTFKIPPRSVTVHPGPTSGVAVVWKSPLSGTVRIKGRIADADPVGGDGVAWSLKRRRGFVDQRLASGDLANGASQPLPETALASVEVKLGDQLQLSVLPKANYGFDTTVVDWTIEVVDGSASWSLARDLVEEPLQGNPHRDRLGHADVWRFTDLAGQETAPRADLKGVPARDQILRALSTPKPAREEIVAAAEAVQRAGVAVDATSPFWMENEADEIALPESDRKEMAALRDQIAAIRATPFPPTEFTNGAQEGGVPGSPHAGTHDVKVHIRGSYARLGELAPRHFPVILAGETPASIPSGSGRRQLADWLTRPDHPLTPRVMVNRIWQQHFGAGIVRTASNFGKLGEPPSHPELLDFLAKRFVESGWSIKTMHRAIMLSATYQQASEPDPPTSRTDPDNRLFGHMNRRRLEAEALRDSLLAAAGQLDLTVGGPALRDLNNRRRTLYLMTVRSDRATFGSLFDAADPTAMVDQRVVSTVAPQALFLLNNTFALEQAEAFARRVIASASNDDARIERAYAVLFGRPPSDEERQIGRESLARGDSPQAAWTAYAQVLLCSNEFLYVD